MSSNYNANNFGHSNNWIPFVLIVRKHIYVTESNITETAANAASISYNYQKRIHHPPRTSLIIAIHRWIHASNQPSNSWWQNTSTSIQDQHSISASNKHHPIFNVTNNQHLHPMKYCQTIVLNMHKHYIDGNLKDTKKKKTSCARPKIYLWCECNAN